MFIVNSILQLVIFYFPTVIFGPIGHFFINSGTLDLMTYSYKEGKIYVESYNFIVIPILLYSYFTLKNKSAKLAILIMVLVGGFTAFLSAFRTQFLSFLIVLFEFFLYFKKKMFELIILVILLLIIFYGFIITNNINDGTNVIDRIASENLMEGQSTLIVRLQLWEYAFKIGVAHPIFGVGLGNLYDTIDLSYKSRMLTRSQKDREHDINMAQDPHDVFFKLFSTSGLVGLIIFLYILCRFAKNDFYILQKKDSFFSMLIISFWTLVLISLFEPVSSVEYQVTFWTLRAIIENSGRRVVAVEAK